MHKLTSSFSSTTLPSGCSAWLAMASGKTKILFIRELLQRLFPCSEISATFNRFKTFGVFQILFDSSIKCLPLTSAVANNPNQNVYHLPPNLCILWHPLVCLATLVFTCQLYCPAHIVFRIPCLLLCSSVLCRDYASLELGKVL